jgi:DNA-directed RNA polymerase specialized sigma24 family protein
MAKQEAPDEEAAAAPRGKATIHDRLAAFAMLDGMPSSTTQAQKTIRLSLAGFSNPEIADLLQTTGATVAQNLYEERKKVGEKKPKRKTVSDQA